MDKAAVYDDPAGVYVRISADPAGLRAGVERQREDCLAEATRRGYSPVVYEDNDMSAYRGKPRPEYERMLADIESGAIKAVVVYDPTRLTRHLKELETLIDAVERNGVQVVTLKAGDWDLTTPQGRFMARQLGLLARLEAETIADRVQRARIAEAKAGRPGPGGRRPWGFEADKVEHHPVEAGQVRDAAIRLLGDESLRSVAARVGMRPAHLKRALLSPRMIGKRSHKGDLYTAVWEPLLDSETWEALRALLTAPERDLVKGRNARRYLLTGFAWCECDAPMEAKPGKGVGDTLMRRRYRCSRGGHVDRAAGPAEARVRDFVLAQADVGVPRRLVDPQLAARAAGFRARLADLDREFVEPSGEPIPAGVYAGQRAKLEAGLQEAEAALAVAADTTAWIDLEHASFAEDEAYAEARAWWDGSDLQQQRRLVDRYVERVVFHPTKERIGKSAPPEAVEIVPKPT